MRPTTLAASLLLTLLAGCAGTPATPAAPPQTSAARQAGAAYDFDMDVFHPVAARHGMVASDQALATRIGLDILKSGGNAVDAAVAVGFALAVALPNAGNLGGGGFMMVHEAKTGRDIALDFREMAPSGASRAMYLDAGGQVIDGKSLYTHYAVGVPGTVAGLAHALQQWGTLPLSRVVAPAAELAEQGYPVSETLAKVLAQERKTFAPWPASQAIFWKNGTPLRQGERLVQRDLAASLRLIGAQGAKAFYEGAIAHKIAAEMAPHAGAITLADLKNYRVVEREPVRGSYRGHEIVTMPPPSSGGAHLVQILNIMERWPMRDWGADSANSIHHMAEAMKLAYADRAEYLGDPDFVQVPLKGLISKRYADRLAATISPDRARPASEIRPGQPQPYESDQTTHYSVVDAAGNAVAVTYTLNTNFGSGIVARGTGILLNNEMDDFAAKPGVASASGLVGGGSDAAAAVAARRADVLRVTTISYVAASVVGVLALAVIPGQWSPEAVWAGVWGGVFTVVGFLAFYLSLVRGAMGVATAIVGASEAVVPVAAAVLWRGQGLTAVAWAGVVAAVLGAILVGLAEPGGTRKAAWWSVGLSIGAGASFGLAVVALDAAPKDSGMVAPAVEMFVGLAMMPALLGLVTVLPALRRIGERVGLVVAAPLSAGSGWTAVVAGACFGAANLVLMLAILVGPLAAVGVVVSLYPVTTILLARILLKEKLVKLQVAGIVAALTGCVLLGVG